MQTGIFRGVYATSPRGGKSGLRRHWFVWKDGEAYRVQPLDGAYQPAGDVRPVSAQEFEAGFEPRPEILAVPLHTPGGAGGHVQADLSDTDEAVPFIGGDALEHELRAEFALGLARLRNGDREGALRLFERIVEVEDGVVPVHKHLFTEFGIHLRKSHLPETAGSYHRRVLALAPGDSHAHFNVARAMYEKGDIDTAVWHLNQSLNITPDLEPAAQFLAYIERRRAAGQDVLPGEKTHGTKQETSR